MTMASNDPIAAILDQLAAHHEQLARLSRTLDEHAAALAGLTATTLDTADPDGYQPEPAPQWWNLPAERRAEPIARLRAWSSTSTGPATATWPPPSARAGKPTTCACTR
jgi:hypothetical protein